MKEFLKIDLTEQILISTMHRRFKYISHPALNLRGTCIFVILELGLLEYNTLFLVFPESILFLIPHNRIFSSEH